MSNSLTCGSEKCEQSIYAPIINEPSLYLDRDCKFCAGWSLHMIILQSFDLWFAQWLVGSEDFDMRVFKDDEMIAEITGSEVGASSSFEEAILHPAINSYWICFWSFQIWNGELQLRLTFEALCSGSQFKHTVQAFRSCSEVMGWGVAAMGAKYVFTITPCSVKDSKTEAFWKDLLEIHWGTVSILDLISEHVVI